MEVAFARPYLTGEEGAAVADVIASGWLSQGPQVREFEQAFAERVGAPEAVATTSCTTALHLALHAIGIGPGDEVIVPSLSFIATANAVWECGAKPVFADIDPLSYNLDPDSAEDAITPRTRAIMPVHQVGLAADMDRFSRLGDEYGVAIVEDAACAIGATYKGRPIGSLGHLACFSLHPRKVITTGEGGMIAVHDAELAERMRRLRAHAMDMSDIARHRARDVIFESYPERGFNLRMTDMQAALGLCQLKALDHVLARRRDLAERYTKALDWIPGLEPPYDPPYAVRTWQSYCVRVTDQAAIGRTELMRQLLADGISTRRGVMAIHREPAYRDLSRPLPHTDAAARDVLMLPLFPDLSEAEQDYVIDRLATHAVARAA
jgi:perosamine synthetase